jgi:hypothetical protein
LNRETTAKVTRFLEWIAPRRGLESVAPGERLLEGIEETAWSTDAEIEGASAAVGRFERNESSR